MTLAALNSKPFLTSTFASSFQLILLSWPCSTCTTMAASANSSLVSSQIDEKSDVRDEKSERSYPTITDSKTSSEVVVHQHSCEFRWKSLLIVALCRRSFFVCSWSIAAEIEAVFWVSMFLTMTELIFTCKGWNSRFNCDGRRVWCWVAAYVAWQRSEECFGRRLRLLWVHKGTSLST